MLDELYGMITQNLLLTYLLGLPAIGMLVRRKQSIALHGALVLLFCTVNAGLLYLIRPLFRFSEGNLFLPAVCVLLNAAVLGILYLLVHFRGGAYRKPLTVQLCAAAYSCAVIGMLMMSVDAVPDALSAMQRGLRQGGGYLLCCLMLAGARPMLCSEKMPAAFRGTRGVYLYAAVLAAAAACLTA